MLPIERCKAAMTYAADMLLQRYPWVAPWVPKWVRDWHREGRDPGNQEDLRADVYGMVEEMTSQVLPHIQTGNEYLVSRPEPNTDSRHRFVMFLIITDTGGQITMSVEDSFEARMFGYGFEQEMVREYFSFET